MNNEQRTFTHVLKEMEHSLNSGHPIVENDFKILDCCDNLDIRTLESLYIHKLKPSLNDQHSSTDLVHL